MTRIRDKKKVLTKQELITCNCFERWDGSCGKMHVHPSELQNSLYLNMLTGLMAMQDLQMSGPNKWL